MSLPNNYWEGSIGEMKVNLSWRVSESRNTETCPKVPKDSS